MDFRNATMIVNASLAAAGPPIMVVGPNGIGKTELLKAISLMFHNTVFSTAVDYGGFKQYESMLITNKVKNLVISDLQTIILKPQNSRGNIIRLLSTLTSEGTQFEMTYSKDRPMEDFKKRKKNYMMNVVIGCTEEHLRSLIREGYHDLMVRFLYVFVDRKEPIDPKKPFKLPLVPKLKWDKKKYETLTNSLQTDGRVVPRESVLLHKLQCMLQTLDYQPDGEVTFYRPVQTRDPKDHSINLATRLYSTGVFTEPTVQQKQDNQELQQFLDSVNGTKIV